MSPWELRRRRRGAGLTMRQVAQAAGTSESNISAYERGAKTPSPQTMRRMVAAIQAGSQSTIFTKSLLSAPAAAAAIRAGIKAGWHTADLLRIIREFRANVRDLVNDRDEALYFAQPSTTGAQRWDALLAGCVEDLALQEHKTPPPWTAGHALPSFWFVSDLHALDAYSFSHSPFSLQIRGVMLDPADLESI